MDDHDDRASLSTTLSGRVGRSMQRLLTRGRSEIEARQVKREIDVFWVRLGKTAFRLVEAGEIDHPALRRAIGHIEKLEAQLERLRAPGIAPNEPPR
jgi:hypothetical protein